MQTRPRSKEPLYYLLCRGAVDPLWCVPTEAPGLLLQRGQWLSQFSARARRTCAVVSHATSGIISLKFGEVSVNPTFGLVGYEPKVHG